MSKLASAAAKKPKTSAKKPKLALASAKSKPAPASAKKPKLAPAKRRSNMSMLAPTAADGKVSKPAPTADMGITGPIPTSVWITRVIPDAIIPPQLYRPPERGWLAWAAELSGVESPSPDTISGNMIEANAPAWAQWLALQTALTGNKPPQLESLAAEIIDPDKANEASVTRDAFESGRPMPVASIVSVERFVGFVPVLRYDREAKQYAVGHGKEQRAFKAPGHAEAMAKAAKWYDKARADEIKAQQQRAKEQTAKQPPLYIDLAVLQLGYDAFLMTEGGDLTAMLNGAHGFYLVASSAWCYAEQMGAVGAARLCVWGVKSDKQKLMLRSEEMPAFAELEGWKDNDAGGFQWEGGEVKSVGKGGAWQVVVGGKTRAAIALKGKQVDVTGPQRKAIVSSAVPDSLRENPGVVLAWATWRTMRKEKE